MGEKRYKDYIESNIAAYKEYQLKARNNEPEMTKFLKSLLKGRFQATAPLDVLEVGCGNGNTLFHLKKDFPSWTYAGFDVVQDLITQGQELFHDQGLNLFVADAEQEQPQLLNKFDLVLVWRMLQGLQDWQKSLQSCSTFVKKGGCMLISTLVNDDDVYLDSVMTEHTATGEVRDVPIKIFSLIQIREELTKLGLEIEHIDSFKMPIAIAPPENGLNTYTVEMQDRSNMQLAGGMLVDHWKLIFARAGR
jgi:ubiquinone/menaquinone biosynthesis C-methylase UbiE